jgi:hypothetical protein
MMNPLSMCVHATPVNVCECLCPGQANYMMNPLSMCVHACVRVRPTT